MKRIHERRANTVVGQMRGWGAILLWAIGTMGWGQIVNTETQRFSRNETVEPFTGEASGFFNSAKNANFSLSGGISFRANLRNEQHNWLYFGRWSNTQFNDEIFRSETISHLRYSWFASKRLTPEAFTQVQTNLLMELRYRTLNGAGVRLNAITRDSSALRIYPGLMYMYEYEELNNDLGLNRAHRASAFLNFTWAIQPFVRLVSTTYFQPRLDKPDDFRVACDVQLRIQLGPRFSFDSAYNLFYDTEPPNTIPTTFYTLANGLRYTF